MSRQFLRVLSLFLWTVLLMMIQYTQAFSASHFTNFIVQQKRRVERFFEMNTDVTIEKDYFHQKVNELVINPAINSAGKKAICVVGGGFGGLYTALKLDSRINHEKEVVYLIDSKDRFVFLPLLYELTVGSASIVEVAPRYEDLLSGTNVKFIRGNVYNIDFLNRNCDIITPKIGNLAGSLQPLKYDQLVLATGNQPRSDMISGANKYAIPFYSLENAFQLKEKLQQLLSQFLHKKFIQVAVIGGSYSGVELATNLVKTIGKNNCNINIIDRNDRILSHSMEYNRNVADRSLRYNGITVRSNTKVKEVRSEGLVLLDETDSEYFLEADLIVFTAGSQPSALSKQLDIEKDKNHRIVVDEYLRSVQYPNVYAVGDCSVIPSNPVPATAQVAMQQSFTIVNNLLTQLRNEERREHQALQKFQFMNLGEMLSLGDYDATISSLNGWVGISGPLASLGRRAVYALRMPTNTQAVKALITATSVTTGKFLSSIFAQQASP